jgi:hypothetical protein
MSNSELGQFIGSISESLDRIDSTREKLSPGKQVTTGSSKVSHDLTGTMSDDRSLSPVASPNRHYPRSRACQV